MATLPHLGCKTNGPYGCCGGLQNGCACQGNPSPTRYSDAGPAVLTGEWDIGNRVCAGGLKKCTGSCGNNYCSLNGRCDMNSTTPIVRSYGLRAVEGFSDGYYTPSAVGVGAGLM